MHSNFENSPRTNTGVSVHAGFPNAATDSGGNGQALDFNQMLVRNPSSTFCFRIRGHAHENHGIYDGDIAAVDRALAPRPEDLVVYFPEDSFVMQRYRSVPKNTEIWGVVTATIHLHRRRP